MLKKINKSLLWNFLNKPLIVLLVGFLILLAFAKEEKVSCDMVIVPHIEYLKNNLSFSESKLNSYIGLLNNFSLKDIEFKDYEEALAFRNLIFSKEEKYINNKWYEVVFYCEGRKIPTHIPFGEVVSR